MLFRLFILFTVVPLVELALLIKVGEHIGTSNTIALVMLTGIAGAYLAREQGIRVVREFADSVQRGDMPADPLLEGLLIVVGGVFLITPGIITDVAGFTLVIPQSRRKIRDFLAKFVKSNISVGSYARGKANFYGAGQQQQYKNDKDFYGAGQRKKPKDDDDVIDV